MQTLDSIYHYQVFEDDLFGSIEYYDKPRRPGERRTPYPPTMENITTVILVANYTFNKNHTYSDIQSYIVAEKTFPNDLSQIQRQSGWIHYSPWLYFYENDNPKNINQQVFTFDIVEPVQQAWDGIILKTENGKLYFYIPVPSGISTQGKGLAIGLSTENDNDTYGDFRNVLYYIPFNQFYSYTDPLRFYADEGKQLNIAYGMYQPDDWLYNSNPDSPILKYDNSDWTIGWRNSKDGGAFNGTLDWNIFYFEHRNMQPGDLFQLYFKEPEGTYNLSIIDNKVENQNGNTGGIGVYHHGQDFNYNRIIVELYRYGMPIGSQAVIPNSNFELFFPADFSDVKNGILRMKFAYKQNSSSENPIYTFYTVLQHLIYKDNQYVIMKIPDGQGLPLSENLYYKYHHNPNVSIQTNTVHLSILAPRVAVETPLSVATSKLSVDTKPPSIQANKNQVIVANKQSLTLKVRDIDLHTNININANKSDLSISNKTADVNVSAILQTNTNNLSIDIKELKISVSSFISVDKKSLTIDNKAVKINSYSITISTDILKISIKVSTHLAKVENTIPADINHLGIQAENNKLIISSRLDSDNSKLEIKPLNPSVSVNASIFADDKTLQLLLKEFKTLVSSIIGSDKAKLEIKTKEPLINPTSITISADKVELLTKIQEIKLITSAVLKANKTSMNLDTSSPLISTSLKLFPKSLNLSISIKDTLINTKDGALVIFIDDNSSVRIKIKTY